MKQRKLDKVYVMIGTEGTMEVFDNAHEAIRYANLLAEKHINDSKEKRFRVYESPVLTYACT